MSKRTVSLAVWSLLLMPCIASAKADMSAIRKILSSKYFENLYSNTYYSLYDRMDPDGYLPESLTGAYDGMFPRTTGPFAFLMMETGHDEMAEQNIDFVLKTIACSHFERIPRVIGKRQGQPVVIDDEHQIDGQAHVILAWARLAIRRGRTTWEDETWPMVSQLMKRTADRTFFQYGMWSNEPGLVRNTALEHSKEGRFWDCWDLLTQCFTGAALDEMAQVADRRGETTLARDWRERVARLREGVRRHLTTDAYGPTIYAEMRLPDGDGGIIYPGLGWVTLAPVAASWEPLEHQVLQNTIQVMNTQLLKFSNGVVWMPTDGYPNGSFSNEMIGKGIGWEIDFARTEGDYQRLTDIFAMLKTVMGKRRIYMEGAWLEGNGIGLSQVIIGEDLSRMSTSTWVVKDAGNGEQTAWWCWAMARLRREVGLTAMPKRAAALKRQQKNRPITKNRR